MALLNAPLVPQVVHAAIDPRGTYDEVAHRLQPCCQDFPHTFNVATFDSGTGDISGTGTLPSFTFSGTLNSSQITIHVIYVGSSYTADLIGTVQVDRSMAGTFTDNLGQSGTWSATPTATLWLGNDMGGDVFQTDLSGQVVADLSNLPKTGMAFDGTDLYFGDRSGNVEQRTSDGVQVFKTFNISVSGCCAEDLAWDTKRQRLWRIDHGNTLHEIDVSTETDVQTFSLPTTDPGGILTPLGGIGIAYDPGRDLLYVSFCQQGCVLNGQGLVETVDPSTGNVTSVLFRSSVGLTAGLAFEADNDSLWVGDVGVVRNFSHSGIVLSTFNRPQPGGPVDGLEFLPASQPRVPIPCPSLPPSNLIQNSGFEQAPIGSGPPPQSPVTNGWFAVTTVFGTPSQTATPVHCGLWGGGVQGGYWVQDLPLATDPSPPATIFDPTQPFDFSVEFFPVALGNQISLVENWDRGGGNYVNIVSLSLTAMTSSGFQTLGVVDGTSVDGSPAVSANAWHRFDAVANGLDHKVDLGIDGNQFGSAKLSGVSAGSRVTVLMGATGGPNSTGSTNVAYDDIYLGSSATTTTSLASSPNPADISQQVTYLAKVLATGPIVPTGGVTFTDGGMSIAGCVNVRLVAFLGSQFATCFQQNLALGTHQIVAAFTGDPGFASSVSKVIAEKVVRVTTTTLASSANPAMPSTGNLMTKPPYSVSLSYTATVTPFSSFTSAPTGTVSFTDDGMAITGCQALPITNGSASCAVTYSSISQHSIAANYSGDQNFYRSSTTFIETMYGTPVIMGTAVGAGWNGYAQVWAPNNVNYTGISATWTVPTVNQGQCPSGTATNGVPYSDFGRCEKSSTWVGVGGIPAVSNGPYVLIQLGTEQDLPNDGTAPIYEAWTEVKTNTSDQRSNFPMTLAAGDSISASLIETAQGTWVMTLKDLTNGQKGSRTVTGFTPCCANSAELIHENTSGNPPAPLTLTTNVIFDKASYATSPASASPAWVPFLQFPAGTQVYAMMDRDTQPPVPASATPSAIDSDDDGFQIADGSIAPPPPSS